VTPPVVDDANRYVLHGGQAGYDRLVVLSRERWPDTEALFRRAGLTAGSKCIDLGCGGGEVTLEIAKWIGPSGSVLGVDLDPVKLELAATQARERGIRNAEFRRILVQDWNEPNAYDATYSRLLLQHLPKPVELLRRMWEALRPGGLLMAEDVDWHGWTSDPPNEGIVFLREKYAELLERRGGDPHFGLRLYRSCLEVGVRDPQLNVVASYRSTEQAKLIARLTLDGISQALVSDGVSTPEEIDRARSSLDRLLADPASATMGPTLFQVSARKSD
jgi:ubiquinone/menaquinone biosynthesis C-methylase UbiE